MYEPRLASHFSRLDEQRHAGRLGMWIFLSSELLLFAGIFLLYFGYRHHYPDRFAEAVDHNDRLLGTINTAILLSASTLVALAVESLREGRGRKAARLLALATLGGVVFLVVKATEWAAHLREGIAPDGSGAFFLAHPEPGWPIFFTLYFAGTGLHAFHVTVGVGILATLAIWIRRRGVGAAGAWRLEIAGLYWHFVDALWVFLWVCFYLLGRPP